MLDQLKANKAMALVAARRAKAEAATAALIVQERTQLRINRKADEQRRIEAVKASKRQALATDDERVHEGGKTFVRGRHKTTCDKLLTSGRLSKRLKIAVEAFAQLVSEGWGASTLSGHPSSNRLTGSYEPQIGTGFGSRTYSDRMLAGLTALKRMERRVPAELRSIFVQVVGEEVGEFHGQRLNLSEIGAAHGYLHKQAASAGGGLVIAVCSLIGLFMKEQADNSPRKRDKLSHTTALAF